MNNIIFTKGPPGSGKSTFLEKYGLKPYTIATDDLRLLYSSPQLSLEGNLEISSANDRKVWTILLEIVENRMQKGDFLIIDATHTKSDDFKKYKKLVEKYRYRAWCLNFSDIALEMALERNKQRIPHKIVREEVIKTMHARALESSIPSWLTAIDKNNFEKWLNIEPVNLSHYKKVHHIGDIQGCYTVLLEYFATNPIIEDEMFIFIGDYIDRGIENAKVINLVLDLFENKSNCIFLEGNHDKYLWEWANDRDVRAIEFTQNTKLQLEEADVSKSRVRNFCRHLKKYFYYKYNEKTVIVTHGGISNVPKTFKTISGNQLIFGVGIYNDSVKCDEAFEKNTPENYYSIHGHRNVTNVGTQVNTKCFNLEGEVEFGGSLRVVDLSSPGFNITELKNTVFRPQDKTAEIDIPFNNENFEAVSQLRQSKLILERTFPNNISSFSFKKEAFYKGLWDEQTVKARGLFINNKNYEVVARSYEKFFNIGEMDFTEFEYLKTNFSYPVSVFKKENGYLGLLGYNSEQDDLIFTSKSSVDNDYSNWFKEIFFKKHDTNIAEIKKLIYDNNLTLAFEVIDPVNDPHIIDYPQRDIILLDAVKRTMQFEKMNFEFLQQISNTYGFNLKKNELIISDENDFDKFYAENIKRTNQEATHEGYVLEDSKGMMVKLKLPYYSFWKAIRDYLERLAINPNTRVKKELLEDPVFVKFDLWIKSKDESFLQKPIVELRKLFFEENNLS